MHTIVATSPRRFALPSASLPSHRHPASQLLARLVFAAAVTWLGGCASAPLPKSAGAVPEATSPTLRAGDIVKITFPRTPTLDTTQQIRRDGKINLHLIGEIMAADLTPTGLETQLLERYAPQLVSKEVRVTVTSSAFAVFVTGAVLRPGKLTPDRALTAFEAVMEAGGFDATKADTKAVTVIRNEGGITQNFTINLKAVLQGEKSEPFYLRAYDVVYVPERFSWF